MPVNKYELMLLINVEAPDDGLPDDDKELQRLIKGLKIDSEPQTTNTTALETIIYLLQHDPSVSKYKLVRRK